METEGGDKVSVIQIKCLSALAALVLTAGAASAQDFTAGKTPAQLFSSDCSTCHHQPNGLGKKYDNGSLASFLREHYTTKPDTAGALAKYVMGFATLRAAPITAPSADETAAARPAEDPKARRRTTSTLSGDGEKAVRRSQPNTPAPNAPSTDERPVAAVARAATEAPTAPRNATALPPRASEGEASPPAAKLNDYAHSGAAAASREAADPLARIRAYATSGAGPQEAAAEAPRPASGKSHRRGDSAAPPAADTVPPAAVPPVSTAPAAPAPAAASVSSGAMPMPLPPAAAGYKPGAPASVSSR
jgi:hypothetical protein